MSDPAKVLLRDPFYDGQFVRTLAAATVEAADLGEAWATARGIRKLTGQSWYDAWTAAGSRAEDAAADAGAVSDRAGARRALLRASEYFRQAYYFVRSDLDDPRLAAGYERHVANFIAATGFMDAAVRPVRIPYEATLLRGYLFIPDGIDAPAPTLIFPAGYDSTAEAGWVNVPAALEHGYCVLLFEGPGQGASLFNDRLFFRPDFEAVLTPVLDWLIEQPEVDATTLVLVGRSFGGYLAPRAAAFERRIAALVCDPAQPDMGARIPDGVIGRVAAPLAQLQSRLSAGRAEFFGARMAAHGLTDIPHYLAELRRYTMLEHAASISCPTLIIEAEHDFAGGSGPQLQAAMSVPADLVHLTAAQGADGHCAGLGQQIWADVVYRWLAQKLPYSSPTPRPPNRKATTS